MADIPKGYQGPGYRVVAKAGVVSGSDYIGFKCKSCGETYAVFDDPSGGEVVFEGDGLIFCDCPHCASGHHYTTSEAVSFRAP